MHVVHEVGQTIDTGYLPHHTYIHTYIYACLRAKEGREREHSDESEGLQGVRDALLHDSERIGYITSCAVTRSCEEHRGNRKDR